MYEVISAEPGNNLFLFTGTEGTAAGGLLQKMASENINKLHPFGINLCFKMLRKIHCNVVFSWALAYLNILATKYIHLINKTS